METWAVSVHAYRIGRGSIKLPRLSFALGLAAAVSVAAVPGLTFGDQGSMPLPEQVSIEFNDYELLVQASGSSQNMFGNIPIVAVVTFQGAGIPGLVASQFTIATNAQLVPPGGSALASIPDKFFDQGGGQYYLSVKPFDDNWLIGSYHFVLKVDARPAYKASGMTIVDVYNDETPITTPGLK